MAKLNITQASKEAGISKNTLYAHMEKGIVSYEIDEDGRKWIDLSEIRRAYKSKENGKVSNERSAERSTDHEFTAKIERLYERQISQLEKQVDALQTENAKLTGILEKQTLRLEYKPESQPVARKKTQFLSSLNATLIGCGVLITGVLVFVAWVLPHLG